MKKSLLTMTAAVALVGAMGAGATLAYFSAESNEVKNSFWGMARSDIRAHYKAINLI